MHGHEKNVGTPASVVDEIPRAQGRFALAPLKHLHNRTVLSGITDQYCCTPAPSRITTSSSRRHPCHGAAFTRLVSVVLVSSWGPERSWDEALVQVGPLPMRLRAWQTAQHVQLACATRNRLIRMQASHQHRARACPTNETDS